MTRSYDSVGATAFKYAWFVEQGSPSPDFNEDEDVKRRKGSPAKDDLVISSFDKQRLVRLLSSAETSFEDRPELEFAYAGEAHIARPADPMSLSDEEWRDFLFIRSNPRGHHFERWRHINGCARFFNAVRETVSDRFLMTYKAGEPRPDISSLTGGEI